MPHDRTPDETDNDPKTQYEDTGTHPHPSMLPLDRDRSDGTADDNKTQKE